MTKPKYKLTIHDKTKKFKEQEQQLKDLLPLLPTLKKHGLEADITKKVRQLRAGRKTKAFTLELSRKFNGEIISVKAPVEKTADKPAVVRSLKDKIRVEIQTRRKQQKEMTKDSEGNLIPIIENYTITNGVSVKKQDMVFVESGSFLKALMKKIREDMVRAKKPTTKDFYIGVEIELAAKEDRNAVCDAIFDAGLGKYITIKDDGSIGAGDRSGITSKLKETHPFTHEICVLVRQTEFEEVIKKLCDVLNNRLNVAVDKTCGLHVHIDMRNRSVEQCFSNLVLSQQFLYGMLPAQRRSSRYSYPVKGNHWRDLSERYHGINQTAYRKYGTLELRMHSGTTNATKIVNWIKFLLTIVDAPAIKTAMTNIDKFAETINLDPQVLKFVKGRIAKFADQHSKTTPSAEEPGTMPNLDKIAGVAPDETATEISEVA